MKIIQSVALVFALLAFCAARADPRIINEPEKKNTPPELSSYYKVTNGISPLRGVSGSMFEFGIDYRDMDGQACKVCQVWIDLNHDEQFSENEKFNMDLLDDADKAVPQGAWETQDWTRWKHFYVKIPLTNEQMDVFTKFRFNFNDGIEGTKGLPDHDTMRAVMIRPILIVETPVTPFEGVPGGVVRVAVRTYIERTISKQVTFNWEDVMRAALPSGVVLRDQKVTKRRENKNYDLAELVLTLDVDKSVTASLLTIDLGKITYVRVIPNPDPKQVPERQSGIVTLPTVKIELAQIRASVPLVTARAFTLGSPFDYSYSVTLAGGYPDKDVILANIAGQTFKPFTLVSHKVNVSTQPGGATEIKVHNVLALDGGVPKQYQVPGFSVGGLGVSPTPMTMFPIDPPAKVPETPEEQNELVRSILQLAQPVFPSGLPGTRMSPVYFAGGGLTLLALISLFFARRMVRERAKQKAEALLRSHVRGLEDAYRTLWNEYSSSKDKSKLSASFHALRDLIIAKYGKTEVDDGMNSTALAHALAIPDDDPYLHELRALEKLYFTTL